MVWVERSTSKRYPLERSAKYKVATELLLQPKPATGTSETCQSRDVEVPALACTVSPRAIAVFWYVLPVEPSKEGTVDSNPRAAFSVSVEEVAERRKKYHPPRAPSASTMMPIEMY